MRCNSGKIPSFDRRVVKRIKVIETDHIFILIYELLHDVGSDESGSPGHQHAHEGTFIFPTVVILYFPEGPEIFVSPEGARLPEGLV